MKTPMDGTLLRIFIGESDRLQGKPLYEAIVAKAHESQLAGATVLRGIMGYGKHSRIHTAKWEALSAGLPVVIEIVDAEEKVRAFLPLVDEMVPEGLITTEKVKVVKYSAPPSGDGKE